jgi:superfamily I DNA/RNA helicase
MQPNPAQQRLIDAHEGIFVVDAGPGTGKTYTIAHRYAAMIEAGVDPAEVLLVTFTSTAAAEMRTRVGAVVPDGPIQLAGAPIATFHAHAYTLLSEHGASVPQHLGIDAPLLGDERLIQEDAALDRRFTEFISRFAAEHPEHDSWFATIQEPVALRGMIDALAARGAIPTVEGWYRDGAGLVRGDRAALAATAARANHTDGSRQSAALAGMKSRIRTNGAWYTADAPDADALDVGGRIDPDLLASVLEDTDPELEAFIHDVYIAYLRWMLTQGYLSHGVALLFAYVLLTAEPAVRTAVATPYVMVDEFQDTNPLQFQLMLLLAAEPNLCVVGDWRQSIYGFQHADVANIRRFTERLDRFHDALTAERDLLGWAPPRSTPITLERTYRSTPPIVEAAGAALSLPATTAEQERGVPPVDPPPLEPVRTAPPARLVKHAHPAEPTLVCDRIASIVGDDRWAVPDAGGGLRPPRFGDVAVFSRTRSFARELLRCAHDCGIPMLYEGGIELYRTDAAKLVLAWLRILDGDRPEGWATVLLAAGYSQVAIDDRIDRGDYPLDLQGFRRALTAAESLGAVLRAILGRYDYRGPIADALTTELLDSYEADVRTRGDLIRQIETGIETEAVVEVDLPAGEDAVTLKTIHAAKGEEYPIVIVANMNTRQFPSSEQPQRGTIRYDAHTGLRATHTYDPERAFRFRRWQYDLLRAVDPPDYDEERRLLYVAMTRAETHLLCTAGDAPSPFYTALPVDEVSHEPELPALDQADTAVSPPAIDTPAGEEPIRTGVHTLLDGSVYAGRRQGKGPLYGEAVHTTAELLARGEDAAIETEDAARIATLLDGLEGRLRPEQPIVCPLPTTPPVVLSGIVDLLVEGPEGITLIDYKTDRDHAARAEYRLQLSAYHHVVAATTDRPVEAMLLWTHSGEQDVIDPLPLSAVVARAAAVLGVSPDG